MKFVVSLSIVFYSSLSLSTASNEPTTEAHRHPLLRRLAPGDDDPLVDICYEGGKRTLPAKDATTFIKENDGAFRFCPGNRNPINLDTVIGGTCENPFTPLQCVRDMETKYGPCGVEGFDTAAFTQEMDEILQNDGWFALVPTVSIVEIPEPVSPDICIAGKQVMFKVVIEGSSSPQSLLDLVERLQEFPMGQVECDGSDEDPGCVCWNEGGKGKEKDVKCYRKCGGLSPDDPILSCFRFYQCYIPQLANNMNKEEKEKENPDSDDDYEPLDLLGGIFFQDNDCDGTPNLFEPCWPEYEYDLKDPVFEEGSELLKEFFNRYGGRNNQLFSC